MTAPVIRLTQHYEASPADVFHAWSDAQILPQWFAPSPDMKTIVEKIDFRVGGSYRINMQAPDGSDNIVIGSFKEIVKNEKITFSWQWERSAMATEDDISTVTIELKPSGDGTDLTLIHEKLSTQESVEKHTQGWTGILQRLVAQLV